MERFMEKRKFSAGMIIILLIFGSGVINAQTVSLDNAIKSAVDEMTYSLKRGNKVAVLSVRSSSGRMSNYIIEELISNIVNQRMVTVVDRAQLDLIQQEMNFQMSGEVSDASAQAIGKKLGAQSIITGSFESLGNFYRFRVRVIEVETAAIQLTYSANVVNDQVVASLLGNNSAAAPAAANVPAVQYGEYKVGDTGPAGGIIFYDKKNNNGGWRYLEAAPYDIGQQCQWGVYKNNVMTGGRIGDGKNNTQNILLALSTRMKDTGRAAQLCEILNINGFNDWFLPSLDELKALFVFMQNRNQLGSFKKTFYWTSTEKNGTDAYVINMVTGKQNDKDKDHNMEVRAIRAF